MRVRVRRDGVDADIAIAALRVGDSMVVRPGEPIAADGVIVEGASQADESLVTGESLPVQRDRHPARRHGPAQARVRRCRHGAERRERDGQCVAVAAVAGGVKLVVGRVVRQSNTLVQDLTLEPTGTALKLLRLVEKRGLEVVV